MPVATRIRVARFRSKRKTKSTVQVQQCRSNVISSSRRCPTAVVLLSTRSWTSTGLRGHRFKTHRSTSEQSDEFNAAPCGDTAPAVLFRCYFLGGTKSVIPTINVTLIYNVGRDDNGNGFIRDYCCP